MLKYETNLTKGSRKPVVCICDYCGDEFSINNDSRINGCKIIQKDACKNCRTLKRQESSLLKYGTKIPSQSKKVRQKTSKTKGVKCVFIEDYKDKILSLYNSQKHMSVNMIAKKLNLHTSLVREYLKKLGLDTTGDLQAKRKRTMKEKYGVEYFLQCEQGQKQLKQTMLQKYGVESLYYDEELKKGVIEKSKKTCLEKYGVEMIVQDPSRQDEFNKKRRQTRIKNGNEVSYKGRTAKELAASIGINLSSFHERVRKLGLEQAVKMEKHTTYLEGILKKWFDETNIEYKMQFYVNGKIADFYLPQSNTIIEVDGLYWHSDAIIKEYKYHMNKRQIYMDSGYKPLFFREDELNNKLDIVKSIILNKLNKIHNKIGARQCKCEIVDKVVGQKFMKDNHLMGIGKGTYFALIYNDEPISIMCVKRTKNKDYEISRFCHKFNHSIQGGFSKLFHFVTASLNVENIENVENMSTLTTFIDLRYGDGNYLERLGFQKVSCHPSFRWTNGKSTFHRANFLSNSGYDKGLVKIWDCGQTRWIYKFSV